MPWAPEVTLLQSRLTALRAGVTTAMQEPASPAMAARLSAMMQELQDVRVSAEAAATAVVVANGGAAAAPTPTPAALFPPGGAAEQQQQPASAWLQPPPAQQHHGLMPLCQPTFSMAPVSQPPATAAEREASACPMTNLLGFNHVSSGSNAADFPAPHHANALLAHMAHGGQRSGVPVSGEPPRLLEPFGHPAVHAVPAADLAFSSAPAPLPALVHTTASPPPPATSPEWGFRPLGGTAGGGGPRLEEPANRQPRGALRRPSQTKIPSFGEAPEQEDWF